MDKYPIYIGRWPDCRCITSACVDDPKHSKDTAAFVKEIVARGQVVERVADSDWKAVSVDFHPCPHHLKLKRRKAKFP